MCACVCVHACTRTTQARTTLPARQFCGVSAEGYPCEDRGRTTRAYPVSLDESLVTAGDGGQSGVAPRSTADPELATGNESGRLGGQARSPQALPAASPAGATPGMTACESDMSDQRIPPGTFAAPRGLLPVVRSPGPTQSRWIYTPLQRATSRRIFSPVLTTPSFFPVVSGRVHPSASPIRVVCGLKIATCSGGGEGRRGSEAEDWRLGGGSTDTAAPWGKGAGNARTAGVGSYPHRCLS